MAKLLNQLLEKVNPEVIQAAQKQTEKEILNMRDNPDLPYLFVKQAFIAKAEKDAGKLESYSFGGDQ
jgi:hypothetical protein